jgi:hypothetical protein
MDALQGKFSYDHLVGLVYRKRDLERGIIRPIGRKDSKGYLKVQIGGMEVGVHRLAYALYYRKWPEREVDHKDGNPANNAIHNLREVTTRQNMQNRASHRAGRKVGATQTKSTGKWQARISVEGKSIHIGTFDTEQEAHAAYLEAVQIVSALT